MKTSDGERLVRKPEVRCSAGRMLVNARKWRNNTSEVALPTLLPVSKAKSNARWRGRSLAFKTRWWVYFSGFRTSRSLSFVFKPTFSLFLLLTDKTRTAVKVIYLLMKKNSVQFIFFHALWMAIFLSFYSVQSAVADDFGHLILFECASLSWAFLLLHFFFI